MTLFKLVIGYSPTCFWPRQELKKNDVVNIHCTVTVGAPRRCGCREHEAFLDETCVKCSDFHLSCPTHGTQVFSAQPLKGYTRLKNETHAFKCLKPDIRCDAEHGDSDTWLHAILVLQYVSMQFERFWMFVGMSLHFDFVDVSCWPSSGWKNYGFPCAPVHPGCCIEPMPHQPGCGQAQWFHPWCLQRRLHWYPLHGLCPKVFFQW